MGELDLKEYVLIFGSWGAALYFVVRYVLPMFNVGRDQAQLGSTVYENARDTINRLENKVQKLENENREVKSLILKIKGDKHDV